MDILIDKKCKCNEKDYFIFVSTFHACGAFFPLTSIHDECKKVIIVNFISMNNCKCVRVKHQFTISDTDNYQFIRDAMMNTNEYGNFPGKLKGIILDLFGLCPFKKQYDFCCFWKTFAESFGIPYQFINTTTLKTTSILYGVKNSLNDKNMALIHIKKNKSCDIVVLAPATNGYVIKDQYGVLDSDSDSIKRCVMRDKNLVPDVIIISMDNPTSSSTKLYQKLFKPLKVVMLSKSCSTFILDSLKLLIANLNSNALKDAVHITVQPYFESYLWVIKKQRCLNFEGNFEIICKRNAINLPFTRTENVYVSSEEIVSLCYWNFRRYDSLETYDVSKYKGSYIQITLSIDANGFCNLNIQKLENLKNVPSMNSKEIDVKLYMDKKGTHIHSEVGVFCDANDDSTVPPYISFFNGLVIGAEAKQLAIEHPTFVVYDIFTLLKMSKNNSNNIKADPKWGFKVEKDSNGILQVIFDTWRGKRKATPAFLLAILINHSLKVAQAYIGFRPTVFALNSWDDLKIIGNQIFKALKILGYDASIDKMVEKHGSGWEYIKVEKKLALAE